MFDTHAHLQFSAFEGSVKEILERAHKAGVSQIIIPSTDVPTSKKALSAQMQFAIKHKKSLLLHNREAIDDFLEVLTDNWDKSLEGKTVFHCCEANERLLTFAIEHDVFIGVDGDVTYNKEK